MASPYSTLIRLYQHRIDEKRKQIVQLENSADGVKRYLDSLQRDLDKQKAFVGGGTEIWPTFEAYFTMNRKKFTQFTGNLNGLEQQIQRQYLELGELFFELKRYDILEERRLEAEAAERNRKEQEFLDEVASVGHERKE